LNPETGQVTLDAPFTKEGSNMRLKIKILGLGCLAILAMGAVTIEAGATTSGHFTSNKDKTTFEGI
jgi:hypothetical protein